MTVCLPVSLAVCLFVRSVSPFDLDDSPLPSSSILARVLVVIRYTFFPLPLALPSSLLTHILPLSASLSLSLQCQNSFRLPDTNLAKRISSQSTPMNNLVIDRQFRPAIIHHQSPDTAPPVTESATDLSKQTPLFNDRQVGFDVPSLGDGSQVAVVADVKDAVLFEDGTEHGLDDDGGGGVGDERLIFVQLAGEEVDPEVAVLAGLWRGADADDLAGSALQDDEVAGADEVAGDRHRVGRATSTTASGATLHVTDSLADAFAWSMATFLLDDHFLPVVVITMTVTTTQRVQDTIGSTLDSAAEGVVATFVVVVTHIVSVVASFVFYKLLPFDLDFFVRTNALVLVFDLVAGICSTTIVPFGDVDLSLFWAMSVVTFKFKVHFRILVSSIWPFVAAQRFYHQSLALPKVKRIASQPDRQTKGHRNLNNREYSPFPRKIYFRIAAILSPPTLNVDLLPLVPTTLFPSAGAGSLEKIRLDLGARLGRRAVGSSDTVTPVRRREDADGNGDVGAEIQLVQLAAAWSDSRNVSCRNRSKERRRLGRLIPGNWGEFSFLSGLGIGKDGLFFGED